MSAACRGMRIKIVDSSPLSCGLRLVFRWEKSNDEDLLCTYGSAYEEGSIGFRQDEVFVSCGANVGGNFDGLSAIPQDPLPLPLPSNHLSSLRQELKNSRRFSCDVGKTYRLSCLRCEELKKSSRKFAGETSGLKRDFLAVHWPSTRSLEQLSLLIEECNNRGRFACVVGNSILSTRPQRDRVTDVRHYMGHFYFVTLHRRVIKLDMGLPCFALNFERALEDDYDPKFVIL